MDTQALEKFLEDKTAAYAPDPVIAFSPAEYQRRLTVLRAAMAEDGIDLLLLSSPAAQCWLHGYALRWYKAESPRHWRPLITTAVHVDHDRFICFDGLEHQEMFRRTSIASDVRYLPRYQRDRMLDFVMDELAAEGWLGSTAGLELYAHVPNAAVSAMIRSALEERGCTVVDGSDASRRVRRIKSDDEIAVLEKAAAICDAGLVALQEVLQPGMTELEAWAVMVSGMAAAGGESAALHEFASVGARAGHAFASRRVLKAGDVLNVDPCGVYHRYHANRTGTYFLGTRRRSTST